MFQNYESKGEIKFIKKSNQRVIYQKTSKMLLITNMQTKSRLDS